MSSKEHFQIQWQGLGIEVRYCRSWSETFEQADGHSLAHLEIEQPERRPLPFTGTGYRSRFLDAAEIEFAGGPVAYALQWLEWAAQDPQWQQMQERRRQLVLL